MNDFIDSLRSLTQISDSACRGGWDWSDGQPYESVGEAQPLDIAYAFYRLLECELDAVASHPPPGLAARVVAESQGAWGDLRGLLLGVPDELLDLAPSAADWPLRDVLGHILNAERRYQAAVGWAVERGEADPVGWPAGRAGDDPVRPAFGRKLSNEESLGGSMAWIDRLEVVRSSTAELCRLSDEDTARPSLWAGYLIDVRFRLGRFAGHLYEHTIHAEKTLTLLGWQPTEAQRMVRQISAARGRHELNTPRATLVEMDRTIRALASQLMR